MKVVFEMMGDDRLKAQKKCIHIQYSDSHCKHISSYTCPSVRGRNVQGCVSMLHMRESQRGRGRERGSRRVTVCRVF